MFFLDIESLGLESTCVCLSAALVYADPLKLDEDPNVAYSQLLESSCFVKFSAKQQGTVPNPPRTVTKSTMEWWKKQGEVQRKFSYTPSESDVGVEEGIATLRTWFNKFPNAKNLPMWVRGSLDQPVFESLFRSYDLEPFIMYNCYRDVRTAIELLYPDTSKAGYVEVPGFNSDQVIKHNPVHDCAYDALMLLRGLS